MCIFFKVNSYLVSSTHLLLTATPVLSPMTHLQYTISVLILPTRKLELREVKRYG